ncbi:MAG: ribose 5-phosphate isomerase B [Tissierellia bacterium]|nr:ribose 5-phosphate isomerase B [Tissierellia bacterium]
MKIVIGSDHGGYHYKEQMKEYLTEKGHEVVDVGTHSEDSVDYPVYAKKTAHTLLDEGGDFGIIFCGTGIGISIAANKVAGIRCANVAEPLSASLARRHNNANMIAMGERTMGFDLCVACVDTFLEAEFEGGRHQRRVDLIEEEIHG